MSNSDIAVLKADVVSLYARSFALTLHYVLGVDCCCSAVLLWAAVSLSVSNVNCCLFQLATSYVYKGYITHWHKLWSKSWWNSYHSLNSWWGFVINAKRLLSIVIICQPYWRQLVLKKRIKNRKSNVST